MFSGDFRDRIGQYKRWQDIQASILGRMLLFFGVYRYYGYSLNDFSISYSVNNRPFIKKIPIDFNISHSANIIVCAFSIKVNLGVDIEKVSEIEIHDFKNQMTAEEWTNIFNAEDKQIVFYDYWTQKEAVSKVDGRGLGISLQNIYVINKKALVNDEVYHLKELLINSKYKCHLATNKRIDNSDLIIRRVQF